MHVDESLPTSRLPTSGEDTQPDAKLPMPAWAKAPGMPGGVPPMFASPNAQPPAARGDRTQR